MLCFQLMLDRALAICCVVFFFFVFKQKTAYEMRISDWSSDVCSSDLRGRSARRTASHGPDIEGCRDNPDLGRNIGRNEPAAGSCAAERSDGCNKAARLCRRGLVGAGPGGLLARSPARRW